MPPSVVRFLRWFRLCLGVAALWLAGCTDNDRVKTAAEMDETAYVEGKSLLKSGRRQEALASFLKVIDKRGDDAPESHLEVGIIYAEHINDPLSAIYHFRRYLTLRPNGVLTTQIRQRIDAATREFARTLPAQPLEKQQQRVDLVATLDKLKQENETLKQELADTKANRPVAAVNLPPAPPPEIVATPAERGLAFNIEPSIPTIRTRTPAAAPSRSAPPAASPVKPTVNKPAQVSAPSAPPPVNKPAAARAHTVRPGDTLSKISQQYYGNRTRVRDIFAANRNVMKSETDLRPGIVLKLP